MALTTQQVADALNAAGMDTPEKFTAYLVRNIGLGAALDDAGLADPTKLTRLLSSSVPLVERNDLLSLVAKLKIEAADLAAHKQAEIKTILDKIAALEAQMRG